MGVRGLASYVAKKKEFKVAEQVDLQSYATSKGYAEVGLVIDGYSLMYKLSERLDWDYYNGGQYAKLHDAAQEYLQSLLALGFKLKVVFDGMLHTAKLNVFMHRRNEDIHDILKAIDQIKDTGEISKKSCKFIMPILAGPIFKAAISELGIDISCTVFEADKHIAHIARPQESKAIFWGVLSQDTDFLIFPTTAYIPFESVSITSSFVCDIYTAEQIAKVMGLPQKKLPLLAALISNDYLGAKDLGDFHNRILPRGVKFSSSAIIDELIYNIKKDKIETENIPKLAEYVFKDKNRENREKLQPLLKEAVNGYVYTSEYAPHDREAKRWIGETSASTWRDTKINLPDFNEAFQNGKLMSEVVSVLFGRQWTFLLPFEDLKKVNTVLLLQGFRKNIYNYVFYDNPRVEYITECLCFELKYFDMRVPVSRKDCKLYKQGFKEFFDCDQDIKYEVMYQVLGFPSATTIMSLESDVHRWLVCTLRIIFGIAKDQKKANKESTFLFEYEVDALLLSVLDRLISPSSSTSSASDALEDSLPPELYEEIYGKKKEEKAEKKEEKGKEKEKEKERDKGKVKLSVYSMNIASLFQLTTIHMRLFNEILGTMMTGYIDFIRGFDGTHFSELYQKIYTNRNKVWAGMDEYLDFAIGDNQEIHKIFLQVKSCALEGFRSDDVFAKQIQFSADNGKRDEKDDSVDGGGPSKKIKT